MCSSIQAKIPGSAPSLLPLHPFTLGTRCINLNTTWDLFGLKRRNGAFFFSKFANNVRTAIAAGVRALGSRVVYATIPATFLMMAFLSGVVLLLYPCPIKVTQPPRDASPPHPTLHVLVIPLSLFILICGVSTLSLFSCVCARFLCLLHSGLVYLSLTDGDGPSPQPTDTVKVCAVAGSISSGNYAHTAPQSRVVQLSGGGRGEEAVLQVSHVEE